jgi:hypothetical protein
MATPVVRGLLIGLMVKYPHEKIDGHHSFGWVAFLIWKSPVPLRVLDKYLPENKVERNLCADRFLIRSLIDEGVVA